MRKRNNKKKNYFTLLLLLVVTIGIGYAFLTQELTINGTGKVTASNWSIYFDNLVFNSGNVALSTGDSAATINPTTLTDVTYTVTLQKPGDFYEFTVDVVNDGTIDAMIGSVSNKLGGVEIDATHPLPAYLNYSVTYSDDIAIAPNHLLEAGDTETYKVRLEYRKDISATDLPSTAQSLTLNFSVEYVQADGIAVDRPVPVPDPVNFSTDSWDTVVAAVKSGNTSAYHVGDTKEIELGNGLGTRLIRIANTSTPAECSTAGFSQTACGFVLEFVNNITTHIMNPSLSEKYQGTVFVNGTNLDGWPASEMRDFLNDVSDDESIINSLPTVIKNAIIDTTVISGHGNTDGETNFISNDKLYLLSTVEIYGSQGTYDTVTTSDTRQLDYYVNEGVTTSNYSGADKSDEFHHEWWLRSASSDSQLHFDTVAGGNLNIIGCNQLRGVSPAFRLAGPPATYVDSCASFENDSWETIISNVQNNNYSQYSVGCKKQVTLGNSLGIQAVRVANNTTPVECSTEGFSQTACGFVLEFANVITNHKMNSTLTSVGGWPASEMRTYLNNANDSTSIISSLPTVIKNAIIDTTVVSGHDPDSGTNYTSSDKLYLLSHVEIYGSNDSYDALTLANTRQLDYYSNIGVTKTNYSRVVKLYNGNNNLWWLRSANADSNFAGGFGIVANSSPDYVAASYSSGVSPAFRLG